jgi:competence protein ComEA
MARRPAPDPELARLVSDRVAHLLGDQRPRRAADPPVRPELVLDDPEQLSTDADLPRGFTRLHLSVVSALIVLGLLCAGWALLRSRPVALASPGAPPSVMTPSPEGGATPTGSSTRAPTIVVHVLGAVRRPGLVRLPEESRVQDAIDAAGGLTNGARPGELNLAQVVADGQQVVIGTARRPAGEVRDQGGPPQPDSTQPGSPAAALDLNRATSAQLEHLPGIGPVTAAAIVAWREQHGRFSRIEELQEVDGIGPKTYARIAPLVRV